MPGLAISLLLIAGGLILALGVQDTASGVELDVIGFILAGVGAFGVLLSLLFMMSLMPWGASERRVDYVEEHHHEPHVH